MQVFLDFVRGRHLLVRDELTRGPPFSHLVHGVSQGIFHASLELRNGLHHVEVDPGEKGEVIQCLGVRGCLRDEIIVPGQPLDEVNACELSCNIGIEGTSLVRRLLDLVYGYRNPLDPVCYVCEIEKQVDVGFREESHFLIIVKDR